MLIWPISQLASHNKPLDSTVVLPASKLTDVSARLTRFDDLKTNPRPRLRSAWRTSCRCYTADSENNISRILLSHTTLTNSLSKAVTRQVRTVQAVAAALLDQPSQC